ncbi:MAG: chromosomal replication initiator protein DnaA, partial [Deltaproteobacteria bacterium]|nr:chromosomal replication initiator protein DnaA [Deltaproteobacteria bacterium]
MTIKNDIWKQITFRLELNLSEPIFKTWFSQTKLSKLDDNSAVINVPNKFIANWLQDNYLDEIRSSFKAIVNKIPHIEFQYKKHNSEKSHNNIYNKSDQFFINNLNNEMNFDCFITSRYNKFAYSSSYKVATKPTSDYNPLYIYSRLSLGKTHLLNAIGNHFFNNDKSINIGYLPSNIFISDYLFSAKNNNIDKFRDKYTKLNILLLDDIQFLSNHRKIQDEFLLIFDQFYNDKKQIVITGDRPPGRLKNFNSHIISRLGSGLLTEIQPPDKDTKINIIQHRLKNDIFSVSIPNDIISLLAQNSNDLKTLVKNINRIKTYISINTGDINLSVAKSLVKNSHKNQINVKDIQFITAGYFNISLSELLSHKKDRQYSYPRQLAMYLCRKYTYLSLQEIGSLFED